MQSGRQVTLLLLLFYLSMLNVGHVKSNKTMRRAAVTLAGTRGVGGGGERKVIHKGVALRTNTTAKATTIIAFVIHLRADI